MADGQTAIRVVPTKPVIGREFTVPYTVNLTLARTRGLLSSDDLYTVKDSNGDVVFKAKRVFFSGRLLLDAAGTPLLTIKPKAFSRPRTWRAFRGESTSSKDLLFSMRKPKLFQLKDDFDVVLATNTDEAAPCDFKIISRRKKCTICTGKTDEIVAQMNSKTAFFARDELDITVNPNEDFAFIVSLIIILEEIFKARRFHRLGGVLLSQ